MKMADAWASLVPRGLYGEHRRAGGGPVQAAGATSVIRGASRPSGCVRRWLGYRFDRALKLDAIAATLFGPIQRYDRVTILRLADEA